MRNQNNHNNKVIIISGPSGVGKSTICHEVVKRINAFLSISVTTRPRGKSEVDGEDYHFVSDEEFQKRIDNGDFLEYARVFGNYYGTPAAEVEDALDQGKTVILEIDVQGAREVKKVYPDAIMIFIFPPSQGDLAGRMTDRARGEEGEVARQRLDSASQEIAAAWQYYHHMVINADLQQAVKEIIQIIEEESQEDV
jgi:guanylate kinase